MSRRFAGNATRAPGTPSRSATLLSGALLSLALFAVLFPWYPGTRRLDGGTVIAHAIAAPRDLTFESPIRTAAVRQQASAAIAPVNVLDPTVRDRQLASAGRILGTVDQVRRNGTLSASARESGVRAAAGAPLSQIAAVTFATATDARFQAMSDGAVSALGRVLGGAIGAGDVDAARARAQAGLVPPLTTEEGAAVAELVTPLIVPTLIVDQQRTDALRREAVANTPPVKVTFTRGQVVVAARSTLTAADVEALERLGINDGDVSPAGIGAAALFAVLVAATLVAHVNVARPAAIRGTRRRVLLALLLLVPAAVFKFALPLLLPDFDRHFIAYALPVAAAPMVASVLFDLSTGVILAALVAGVAGFVAASLPSYGAAEAAQVESARLVFATGGASLAAVFVAARADRLQRYLLAGFAAAGASGVAFAAALLIDPDRRVPDLVWAAASILGGGVLVAIVAVGALVFVGRPFRITTRVELMELAQLSHPLLRRLQDEAPGTFQHSILVSNLAERAATRIGADALLVRVGAYYHDVGKLVAPPFFIENLTGQASPHDNMDPLQSTRVIQQHVTAGVDLARRAHLPEAVVEFIPQHHGTRLAAFFYRRAAEVDPEISPDQFRYPGPRPQSRETALVMLADASEASVRASADRSPERIRELVEGIVRERVEEGQFDQCDLSLRDLRLVADSYVASLSAVYHPRIEYPEPTRRELAARGLPTSRALPAVSTPGLTRESLPPPPGGARPMDEDDV